MSVEIEEKDFGLDDILDDIASAKGRNALAGYHNRGGGFNVAALALVQEMGAEIQVTEKMRRFLATQGLFLKKSTTKITIPARPSVRESFDNNVDDLGEKGSKLFGSYLEGKIDLETALEVWGDDFLNILRNSITSRELDLAPNHPFTTERKGSDTPLVDSSRMINSSTVEIE